MQVPTGDIEDEQPRKCGIWFTERLQVASWRLSPGQRIVAHHHPRADSLTLVLSGRGDYLVYERDQPDPAVCYVSKPDEVVVPPPPGDLGEPSRYPVQAGSVTVAAAETFYGLVNTGDEQLVAVVVTGPDPVDSVYTVRGTAGLLASL
jgi:oxalate decarboxylase/phosphoglucose isomerase-like protein (cupin superfamily)